MPRVSAEHLTARRDQIIDAAIVRFAANGFQATGMADVIAESGLSAGAVYRYFTSKDDLIRAIVDRVLGRAVAGFDRWLAEQDDPDPAEAVATAVDLVADVAGRAPVDPTRVAVQAWAEALRNPAVYDVVQGAYGTIRSYLREAAVRAQAAGRLPRDADPHELSAAMLSLVLGFLLQRLLLGDVPAPDYGAAVRVLLAGPPPATAS
ncbi:TetR/AcrR family transcriptional regulator [Geodermatophilus sabuli]|uniref:TetR/AcrR family transcriptional regulator n=1 Tax=Geodermatophilus sabuli TaxID=1564158 RepID=A0A7K3W341_9ACTN|nr:TetR/AcrR family transcriptional regulator [Geodermatophilus sabuli]NEK58753.1 TetR/AcrR family transcriptional regulator [Geodermatophilus sabuli]